MIEMKAYKAEYNGETQILLERSAISVIETFEIEHDPLGSVSSDILANAQVGFLTDEGVFLTPEEALTHALEAGQISEYAQKIIKMNNAKRLQTVYLKI